MEIELNRINYREGTVSKRRRINFILNHGGIGDYICWLTAMEWCAIYNPQIQMVIGAPKFFLPIVQNVFKRYPQVKVVDKLTITDDEIREFPTYLPTKTSSPVSCVGANLIDLGFIYYANRAKAPDYHNNYCQLDLADIQLSHERFKAFNSMTVNYSYAVLTPYYSHNNRKLPVSAFNKIKDYLLYKKITPVLVGQEAWAERRQQIENEYDFSKCINLLDKTTLLEAAKIMSSAKMVIGVDNGLLHLAGMTSTPIIFGYTIVGPEFRKPRRKNGITLDVFPNKKELACTFCLTEMRYHYEHSFNHCIYKDDLCVKMLEDFRPWKKAIDDLTENKVVPLMRKPSEVPPPIPRHTI